MINSDRQGEDRMRVYRLRKPRAMSLPEFAGALVIGLPILIAILFTALECSQYFVIKTKLEVASRSAARQLSIAYGRDPSVSTNPTKSNPIIAAIYDAALIPSVINDKAQFSDPLFVTGVPATVTVIVKYPVDGSYGLNPFPNPDPLHLANRLQPVAMATFALE